MQQLKALLGENYFIYGPMTKEQAFDVHVDSRATVYNNQWYAATINEYQPLSSMLICYPGAVELPPAPASDATE